MQESPAFPWDQWRRRLREAGNLLIHFARNPVQGMRNLPQWDWPFLLVCQSIAAAACGFAAGVVGLRPLDAIVGLFFSPISNLIASGILAGFFYYVFGFFLHRPATYHAIYTHITFAQLPALVLMAVAPVMRHFVRGPAADTAVSFLMLVGFAATAMLLLVGFVDNLKQERRTMVRLLVGLLAFFTISWVVNAIQNRRQTESLRQDFHEKTLDILENELKN